MFYTSMNGSKRQNTKGNQKLDSWSISEQNFPTGGSNYDKLKFFLSYAILAPSSHNTQPWLFKIVDNSIELYADRTRALPVVDPEARELTISCGAALYHLIVTIKYFGFEYRLEVLPAILANQDKHDEVDGGRDSSSGDDLLARVIVEGMSENRRTFSDEEKLFQAITKRRTNRFIFQNRDIPALLLSKIEANLRTFIFRPGNTIIIIAIIRSININIGSMATYRKGRTDQKGNCRSSGGRGPNTAVRQEVSQGTSFMGSS
jgi:hypothetical protein